MKKRNLVLIMIAVFALLPAAASVSAQDIDIENMDNAELTALLRAILQKLETNGADGASKPVSEGS